MAHRERQKLVEATETAGAVQASEEPAAQAASAASAAASGAGTSEPAKAAGAAIEAEERAGKARKLEGAGGASTAGSSGGAATATTGGAASSGTGSRGAASTAAGSSGGAQHQEGAEETDAGRQDSCPWRESVARELADSEMPVDEGVRLEEPVAKRRRPDVAAVEGDYEIPDEEWEFTLPGTAAYEAAGAAQGQTLEAREAASAVEQEEYVYGTQLNADLVRKGFLESQATRARLDKESR
eukprot:4877577-Amphidinium_carterae.1